MLLKKNDIWTAANICPNTCLKEIITDLLHRSTDWLLNSLTHWLTSTFNLPVDSLNSQLDGWLVDWLTSWLTGWLIDLLVGWLTWLTGWPTGGLAGWLTGWLAGWLTGWLAPWLGGWLSDWWTTIVQLLWVKFRCSILNSIRSQWIHWIVQSFGLSFYWNSDRPSHLSDIKPIDWDFWIFLFYFCSYT